MVDFSSPYGPRNGGMHNGVDIRVPVGTPVRSSAPGRVVKVYVNEPRNGSGVQVDHGGGWRSIYLHLSRIDVRVGDLVGRRQVLGLSGGARGTWGAGSSSGPHLHFMVLHNGAALDPVPLVNWR